MNEQTDNELIWKCLEGEVNAFGVVVQRYEKPVFNVALRMIKSYETAQDITQTVFIKAYEKLRSFDYKKQFFSWIYRIAVNESINVLKQSSRHDSLEAANNIEAANGNPEEVLQENEQSAFIQKNLMQLNSDYRTVIVLKYFTGLTYQEMSDTLEIPVKTVKSRLFSARQLLKDLLIKDGVVEND